MGIFEGILLMSDMDGTLLDNGVLKQEQLEAVKYFESEGGIFCPATGRQRSFLKEDLHELSLSGYCIEKNGTMIYDYINDRPLWKNALKGDPFTHMEELTRKFENVEKVIVHKDVETDIFPREKILDGTVRRLYQDEEIFKLVLWLCGTNAAELAEYCKDMDDFEYSYSCDHLFEICNDNSGKGVCAEILKKTLGDRVRITVGIGDYDNDVALLQAVDLAVAVESDCKQLRQYADVIAPPIEEHPIRWLVQYLEKRVREGNL